MPWEELLTKRVCSLPCSVFQVSESPGRLVRLVSAGWNLTCPFPGDLFARFNKLQGLFLSYNQLSVGLMCLLPGICYSLGSSVAQPAALPTCPTTSCG